MINLLKNIFKQEKVEFVPTDNWFEPMRIDGGWTIKFVYQKDFFDE